MTDILVRPPELRQAAEKLRAGAQKIGEALQAIDNDINTLKGDHFLGNRATALQSHYAAKRDALLKAKDLVSHFSHDLEKAAARFETADKRNSSLDNSFPRMPMPAPTPPNIPPYWNIMNEVANYEKGVTPELIAAILEYEKRHRDIRDGIEDLEAKFILLYEGELEETEIKLLNSTLALMNESLDSLSFGPAQMNPEVLKDLVEKGYIAKPENWDTDRTDTILSMLLSEEKAPALIAARLEQIHDHWMKSGVDISQRPDVLGNLYGIGLQGQSGIRSELPEDQGPRGEEIEIIMTEIANSVKTL